MVAHYYIPQQHVRIETYSVVRCALACFVCLTILGCQEPKTSKAPSKTPSNSFDIDPQAEGRSLERNRLEPHGDLATAAVKMKGYLGIDSCGKGQRLSANAALSGLCSTYRRQHAVWLHFDCHTFEDQ